MLDKNHPLCNVNDVFNAITVKGDAVGDVMFYGRGAGKLPTASAVVADVIDCARHTERRKFFGWDDAKQDMLANYLDIETALYVRGTASDCLAVKTAVYNVFGKVTYLNRSNQPANEIAFVTPVMKEADLRRALSTVGLEIISTIRVADY